MIVTSSLVDWRHIISTAVGDFIPFSNMLTFEPSQMNQTFTLSIINDHILELNEQFSLVLESKDEAVFIQEGRSTLEVTIRDQTGTNITIACYVACFYFLKCYSDLIFGFDYLETTVQESDDFVEVIMGLLESTSSVPFNISFATRNGTATDSLGDAPDFINIAQTVVFAPHEQRKAIRIPIVNDSDLEEDSEYFFVELLHTKLRVTINDDDCKPI